MDSVQRRLNSGQKQRIGKNFPKFETLMLDRMRSEAETEGWRRKEVEREGAELNRG
ncbi:hypothetical protein SESBI_50908 [Sesbania bispinosa]|nr:hypothetical protein SESBI_50908 [Sesbania bispinosa]